MAWRYARLLSQGVSLIRWVPHVLVQHIKARSDNRGIPELTHSS